MTVQNQIKAYINSLAEPKRNEMETLHRLIVKALPKCRLWFTDGKNSEGKIVANPNIGYGFYTIHYADGTTKEFYQIGISANTTGISVYIMGLKDKNFLIENFGNTLGKASVTGYCIKFKKLQDIHIDVLMEAILHGIDISKNS